MSFKECDGLMPAGMFFALADDGKSAAVVFMGEPIPREEDFKGQAHCRAYFPVLTKDGLKIWGVGSRTYRLLRDGWQDYTNKGFTITRHGAKGSTSTTYGLTPAKVSASMARAVEAVTAKEIKDLLDLVRTFGDSPQEGEDIPV
jgi:hypothetical protein